MSYKIVTDSCCDYTPEMKTWSNLTPVPLILQIGDFKTADDASFDQEDFVKRMQAYHDAAKSACPSLESWMKAYDGEEEEVYVITITGKLSGTYNSALQAANLFEEETGKKKKIHVFDSKATSAKETIIALKIKELVDKGKSFEEVVEEVTDFIDDCGLYFVIGDLENLRKNGRLSNLQSTVLKALRVKLIMKETDGDIDKLTQDISLNRAVLKMADIVIKQLAGTDTKNNYLVVTHCMNPQMGQMVYDRITAQYQFKDSCVMGMGGLNTLYTNVGGVLIGYSK